MCSRFVVVALVALTLASLAVLLLPLVSLFLLIVGILHLLWPDLFIVEIAGIRAFLLPELRREYELGMRLRVPDLCAPLQCSLLHFLIALKLEEVHGLVDGRYGVMNYAQDGSVFFAQDSTTVKDSDGGAVSEGFDDHLGALD